MNNRRKILLTNIIPLGIVALYLLIVEDFSVIESMAWMGWGIICLWVITMYMAATGEYDGKQNQDCQDELVDAGNELYRLTVETRDSIYDSGTIIGEDRFPDTEEGKDSEAWWEEHRDACLNWKAALSRYNKRD